MVVGESDFIFNFKTQAEQNVETVGRKYFVIREGKVLSGGIKSHWEGGGAHSSC